MKAITQTDLRTETTGVIDAVEHHKRGYVITRSGRHVGVLLPLTKEEVDGLVIASGIAARSEEWETVTASDQAEISNAHHALAGALAS